MYIRTFWGVSRLGIPSEGGSSHRHCVGVVQPFLQQRFQFAHVLEAQIQCLEPRDGRLREVVAVELAHSQADVALCEP